MTPWLLDVNVLVARFWDRHPFYAKVRTWMDSHESDGWATCPITQLGAIRTISNPAFDKQIAESHKSVNLADWQPADCNGDTKKVVASLSGTPTKVDTPPVNPSAVAPPVQTPTYRGGK